MMSKEICQEYWLALQGRQTHTWVPHEDRTTAEENVTKNPKLKGELLRFGKIELILGQEAPREIKIRCP